MLDSAINLQLMHGIINTVFILLFCCCLFILIFLREQMNSTIELFTKSVSHSKCKISNDTETVFNTIIMLSRNENQK